MKWLRCANDKRGKIKKEFYMVSNLVIVKILELYQLDI